MAIILNIIYGTKTLPALFLIFFLYLSKLEFPSWNKYPERKKALQLSPSYHPFINALRKVVLCSTCNGL